MIKFQKVKWKLYLMFWCNKGERVKGGIGISKSPDLEERENGPP